MSVYQRANVGGTADVETTAPSMAAGFTLDDYFAWQSGNVLTFAVYFTRSGATIAGPDITNTAVCTLPTAQRGDPTFSQMLSSIATGPVISGMYSATTGIVRVTATADAAGIVNGSTYSLGGTVLL